jgi:hypothetical protein
MYVTANGAVYLTGITNGSSNAYYSKNDSTYKIPNTYSASSSTHGIFAK